MLEEYYIYVYIISFLCLCVLIWVYGHNKNRKSRKYVLWAAMVFFILQISITAIIFPLVEEFDENSKNLMVFVNKMEGDAYKAFGNLPEKVTDMGNILIKDEMIPEYNMNTVSNLQTISNMQAVITKVADKTAPAVDKKVK